MIRHFLKPALGILLLCALSACGDSRERIPSDAPGYVDGKPVHPTIKIGKPYRVMGQQYYPKYQPDYEEEGIASWYGPNFHGESTANGESYNQWAMTAAHKTLPMPSMVRVINKKNGKSVVVRINDRGPFVDGRIIDLSRAAAEELGVHATGIAPVKVEYLKEETEHYIAKLQLKKPDEWREIDVAHRNAETGESITVADAAPVDSVITSDHVLAPPRKTPDKIKPPAALAAAQSGVTSAFDVPKSFAYDAPAPTRTTLDVRGVTMEEIGYSEDPFTVLGGRAYAHSATAETPRQVLVPPPRSLGKLSQPVYDSPPREPPDKALQPPKPLPVASGTVRVQAGTFSSEQNANALAEKRRSIATVQVQSIERESGTLWRVTLGPMLNVGIAEEVRERLAEYAIHDAQIIEE